ncbi:MAG: hypothetical protein KAX26_05120, partial [Anaerolineae bacterium]|nr:hypothetical protein [Anaerolineae bacterium]
MTAIARRNGLTWKKIAKGATPYLLVLPVVLYYAAFWLRPVISSVIASFTGAAGQFTLENFALV